MVMQEVTPGVWLVADPVSIVGMKLTTTMTVIELPGRELLIYSPLVLTAERRAAVESLGTVAHLYAPNTFHHLWIGEWAAAFPNARVHAPAALKAKRPDLHIDRAHDHESLGALSAVFDEVHIDGFLLEETVLVHRASQTLLVADLVHNVGRPTDTWSMLYTKAMGFYDRVAISRAIRWTAFRDRSAARDSVDRLAQLSFDRLVVGHGTPLESGARAAVLDAYDWLHAKGRSLVTTSAIPRRGHCG
jgi:hypothetical protein